MRRVVMIVCATVLFFPVLMKSRMSQDFPAHTAFHALPDDGVTVKVCGDVLHPGIYVVPANTLATIVINMAVPLRPLKSAMIPATPHPLLNGSSVVLSLNSDGSFLLKPDTMTVSERMVLGIPLDISTMDEADFDRLPGVGPALAKRIVRYRQNNGGNLRVCDLMLIEGIGEKKYKVIFPFLQPP